MEKDNVEKQIITSSWAAPKSEAGGYIFEKTIGLK
jgi:hypothetical protein